METEVLKKLPKFFNCSILCILKWYCIQSKIFIINQEWWFPIIIATIIYNKDISIKCQDQRVLKNTRTSVAPRRHFVLVGYWQSGTICMSVTHRQNIFSCVTHRWTEYLSFVWVMCLLAVGYSWTELLSFIWVMHI